MRDGHYIIGLTGGIASGKTMASEHMRSLGLGVVDADEISRSVTAPGGDALPPIRARFGDGVFLPDGTLDRRALGELVFASEPQRRCLEAIIHPMVQKYALAAIQNAPEPILVLSVPLLFETGMDVLCDEVWVTSVDRETQVMRVMARDKLSREAAARRVDSQMPPDDRLKRADVVVRTDRPAEETRKEIDSLVKERVKRLRNA